MIQLKEIVSILLVGISLSMDTFSMSLSLATIGSNSKTLKILPILVGIFHFFMPLFGNFIGSYLISLLSLTSNKLLGIILLILGLNIAYHYFKEERIDIRLNLFKIIIIALSVSIDSFSVGLGISALTNNYITAYIIFAFCSAVFTSLGLTIGKYGANLLGKRANLLGIVLLITLGVIHLLQ